MSGRGRTPDFGGRLRGAGVVVCVVMSLLVIRLWYLQGIRGAYFRDLSENNRTRTVRTLAPRGNIYDRNDRIVVQNRPAFNVALMLEDTPDVAGAIQRLSQITGRPREELDQRLQQHRSRRPFEPRVVLSDVNRVELARVKVRTHDLPGVIVDAVPARAYPFGELGAHMLGYVREISRKQLTAANRKEKRYRAGDMYGQAGFEKQWEPYLQGASGYRRVEVDAMGKRRGELGIADDVPGNDLYLTLDLDVQQAAEAALVGERGAIVAVDPRNGEVLALASAPSFDANLFSGRIRPDDWNRLRSDRSHPLTNRTIAEMYAPGSTFKLIMAAAGLNERVVTPRTTFPCPGYYLFAGRRYHCHKRSGHGRVNLRQAVTMSCDSYFYQLGQKLGISLIHRYATMFGLGSRTGIDLPGEVSGIAPSNEWKLKYLGERWYPGETLSVSIGQGFLTTTPLQMAVATAAIANGGTVYQPRLLRKIVNRETGVVHEGQPQGTAIELPERILEEVRSYAVSVTEHERGTGKASAIPGIRVGGKTGTAQVVSLGKETLSKRFRDHAWFVAFAPAEEPTIALSIIVENGGNGSETAAPISQKVLQAFFRARGMLVEEEPAEDETAPTGSDAAPSAEA